jgi:hypothetical protein
MSLYCFGKIIPVSAETALSRCAPVSNVAHLYLRDLEPDDVSSICQIDDLKPAGITFRYVDSDGGSATQLWVTASEVARLFAETDRLQFHTDYSDAMKATNLGGFVWSTLHCSSIKAGALALVDGGIETIFRASPIDCWNHFLTIISKPWDCHDNPLLVWNV